MKISITIIIILLLTPAVITATAIGDAAAQMSARTMRPLQTQGLTPEIVNTENPIYPYANDAMWDPNTEQFLFAGRYHGKPWACFAYNGKTNMWRNEALPWSGGHGGHTYDNMTTDFNHGIGYFFTKDQEMFKFNFSTNKWSSVSQGGTKPTTGHGMALEYFPEMNGLVHVYKNVVSFFDLSSSRWSTLKTGVAMAGYHHLAEYSRVHKCVILGGGNDNNQMHRLDKGGSLTALKPAPFTIGISGGGLLTCDPVSGDYLYLREDSLYCYDVVSDKWESVMRNPFGAYFNAVVTPISNYGVVMFVSTYSWPVVLYKHADAQTPVNKSYPKILFKSDPLSISPNPFKASTTIKIAKNYFKGNDAEAGIYSINGRLVEKLKISPHSSTTQTTWNASHLPSGVYIIKVSARGHLLSRRILLHR
jgi:hypothetical protein